MVTFHASQYLCCQSYGSSCQRSCVSCLTTLSPVRCWFSFIDFAYTCNKFWYNTAFLILMNNLKVTSTILKIKCWIKQMNKNEQYSLWKQHRKDDNVGSRLLKMKTMLKTPGLTLVQGRGLFVITMALSDEQTAAVQTQLDNNVCCWWLLPADWSTWLAPHINNNITPFAHHNWKIPD